MIDLQKLGMDGAGWLTIRRSVAPLIGWWPAAFELTSDDIPMKTKAEPKAKKRAGGARKVKIKECFKTIVVELILLL
jgi:hypothetical protein